MARPSSIDLAPLREQVRRVLPSYTRLGLLGSVGGSWQSADDFRCVCGCRQELIAWCGPDPRNLGCFRCFASGQLSLEMISDVEL